MAGSPSMPRRCPPGWRRKGCPSRGSAGGEARGVRSVGHGFDQRPRCLSGRAVVAKVVVAHHVADLRAGHGLQFVVGSQRSQVVGGAYMVDQAQRRRVDRSPCWRRWAAGWRMRRSGVSRFVLDGQRARGHQERGGEHERCASTAVAASIDSAATSTAPIIPPRCLHSPEQSAGILAEAGDRGVTAW